MKLDQSCWECQLKHLRAALAYALIERARGHVYPRCVGNKQTFMGELSRAAVLLFESVHADLVGHRDLAAGFASVAEDLAVASRTSSDIVRAVRDARKNLDAEKFYVMADMFYGHLLEAKREGFGGLPEFVTPDAFIESFEEYVKTVGEVPADTPEKKGGEVKMKCKKCAAKGGEAAKATRCAAKGGKAAKATRCAAKGGKAKKSCK